MQLCSPGSYDAEVLGTEENARLLESRARSSSKSGGTTEAIWCHNTSEAS